MNKNSDKIYAHFYPSWVLSNPSVIHVLYFINYLIHLRKWHIQSALKHELGKVDKEFRLLDAGVGEGQFLIPLAKNYPKSHFTGIDKLAGHQLFCSTYAIRNQLKNVEFQTQDLEVFYSEQPYDFVLCIGVLQYIQNDELVLNNFYRQLNQGGILLLYVPVHNRSILPFYRSMSNRLVNYETIQERQRIYTKAQIESLLLKTGFQLAAQKDTYGFFGIISNELINTYLMLFNKSQIIMRFLLSVLFIMIYPLILLFMIIDFYMPKQSGNGLLIIARK